VFFYSCTAEEEANSVKLQEEMMYQSSEHAVAIETLKADYENVLERTSTELKMKHEGEIALGGLYAFKQLLENVIYRGLNEVVSHLSTGTQRRMRFSYRCEIFCVKSSSQFYILVSVCLAD